MGLIDGHCCNDEFSIEVNIPYPKGFVFELNKEEMDYLGIPSGIEVESPIYLRACYTASSPPTVREDPEFIHQKIVEASGGVIDSMGFPLVEGVDAYKVLVSQMFLVDCAIEPVRPDGYRYPSSEGMFDYFVVTRHTLLDVILEVTGD